METVKRFDLIVVGGGIAGLYAALLAAPRLSVALLTKADIEESNTRYAQGGVAAALRADDSSALHLRDTLAAGDGICDPLAVAHLTREGPECIRHLIELGVPFDREADGLAFTLEAAHSLARVLHAGGDATGKSIEQVLAQHVVQAGVTIMEHTRCTSLEVSGGRVHGVRVLRSTGEAGVLHGGHVILASGGAGQLFARTTNPAVATADGLALAYRAGAELMDLEFMQFHPTALAVDGAPSFLISEAVRGEGGVLRNADGSAFMERYHPDRELAPRDVVARAIHTEIVRTGAECVFIDITHLDPAHVEQRFPTIMRVCRHWNIDPIAQPIPVAPAAHYMMGGVRTDVDGRTSVPGLFACGEVACTGVHGANRLASNSLLEGLVFGRRAVSCILSEGGSVPADLPGGTRMADESRVLSYASDQVGTKHLADVLWRLAGLTRTEASILEARKQLSHIGTRIHTELSGLNGQSQNDMVLVADLVTQSALMREESRGAHFRSDFPVADAQWLGHIVVSLDGASFVPLFQRGSAPAQSVQPSAYLESAH